MLVVGTSDERIARIASRQRGRVSRRQLLAAGLSDTQVSGRIGRGQLHARRRDREQGPRVTRSEAEERLLALVRGGDLPEPEVNVRRHGWEIDFLWPEARLAVEIDGYQFHCTHANFTRDRGKDAQLAAHGITVIRSTWDQLVDTPLAVVARISGLLAQRS